MKNWLNYYYNINIDEIHQKEKNYFFEIGNYKYIFFPFYRDIKDIKEAYTLSEELLNNGIYCHKIILNKDNNYFTLVDSIPYILMESYFDFDKKVEINDIIGFQKVSILNNKKRFSWKNLWEEKIDYFEYQLNQFGKKHPLILESFGYFSGYVETAIALLNNVNIDEKYLTLSHKRINADSTLFDLYNPFNLIFDYRLRDICEFYKSQIFQKKNILEELMNYLNSISLNSEEYLIFFIRMLYPTTYFDYFEKIMNNNLEDDDINFIIDNIYYYEDSIKKIYIYLSPYLPKIEWLSINL